mgnify:CR=1 FL=1
MRREIKELYLSTVIMNLAIAMVQIFEPIYLYAIGYSLQEIMLFFFIVYFLYLLIMPFGAKFTARFGNETSIVLSSLFITLLYLALYGVQFYPGLFYVAAVLYALQKTFYWPAFHSDFAQNVVKREQGREVSGLALLTSVMFILGPVLAGSLIFLGGYGALFLTASVIFILSNIPLLSTKERVKRQTFSYVHSFQTLFGLANRRQLIAYIGFAEELTAMVVWPIFISTIISGSFDVGLIIGATALLTAFITLGIGRWIDHHHRHPILWFGSALNSIAWLMRVGVGTAFGIFWVGTVSSVAKSIVAIPLTAITYSRAKKISVLSSIVAFESALVIGKLLMIVILYFVFSTSPNLEIAFSISFVLAALTSLLYTLL